MEAQDRLLDIARDSIIVSSAVHLNDGGNITCEYLGCSGDCDCDGDTGLPNPAET
jgi:hypothetical protein